MNARLFLKSALATLVLGTAGATATHAQQPSLLNPLTWFNQPTYRPTQSCPTGTCPNVRPVSYQTNYAPAVANTYYYPQQGYSQPAYNQANYVQPVNAYPNAVGVNPSCPNGICPTGQCVNGQCPTGACPNGNCNMNCVNGQCFPVTAPVYAPNGNYYAPTGAATSPYYTSQTQPVNYTTQPIYSPTATQPVWTNPNPNVNVNPAYVPPFRGRAADLPMEYGVNYR